MSKSIITDWTYDHLIKQYSDFLVVCIHSICFYRNLYDRTYFTLTRAYNCPVQRCKHPLLSDYINGVVTSIAEELRKCNLERIAVVILNSQEVALERFIFDVSSLPRVAQEDIHIPFRNTEYQVGQLDGQFRSAVMKLALVETRLGPVPPGTIFPKTTSSSSTLPDLVDPTDCSDCTFAVQIDLRKDGNTKASQAWVETESEGQKPHGKTTVPLRRIVFGPVKLDSWVEETQAKLKLSDTQNTSNGSTMDLSF